MKDLWRRAVVAVQLLIIDVTLLRLKIETAHLEESTNRNTKLTNKYREVKR